MRCTKCGCHHPPFAPNEEPVFTPGCQCECHKIQITWRYPDDRTNAATIYGKWTVTNAPIEIWTPFYR